MYRFVAQESTCPLSYAAVNEPSQRQGLVLPGGWWLLALLFVSLLGLGGCGSKVLSTQDPFAVIKETFGSPSVRGPVQKRGTPYLPEDDGKPLSPEELTALMSEGEIDRNLSSEDMQDVILHFKFLVHSNRQTVEKSIERGQFYLPYVMNVFQEKGLPKDLAWVAFIESNFNPQARSRTGATGMWQFVSATGKYYGMEQDWWIDERKDPYQATRAAADYLGKLYKLFNDWHLAVTAYNAGEGKISRGLAATGAKSFFELRRRNDRISADKDRLSDENKQYLPKFLAVCKIMRNLEGLGFTRFDFSRTPTVDELRVKPNTDLMAVARGVGMDWDTFSQYNPAYQRYVSHPNRPTRVYVPRHLSAQARVAINSPQASGGSGWANYTVRQGDTMASISRKIGVPVADLRRLNQVSEPLKAGKKLKIPRSAMLASADAPPSATYTPAPRTKSAPVQTSGRAAPPTAQRSASVHEVQSGDTVYSIARRYGVDQQDLLAANGMRDTGLRLGQRLTIPKDTGSAPQRVASASVRQAPVAAKQQSAPKAAAASKVVNYRVQNGDSVWSIARKFNVSPVELLSLNNMSRDDKLRPGDMVRVALN